MTGKVNFPSNYTWTEVKGKESENTGTSQIRAAIASGEEAEAWVKEFGQLNNTDWIVRRSTCPQKLTFRKIWVCQHNSFNKTDTSLRSTNCAASIDITIKKVNRNTIRNDHLLALCPPLAAIVTISGEHNHNRDSADSLRLLRATDALKEQFYGYFESGMTPSEAIQFHTTKLWSEEDEKTVLVKLADQHHNPTHRTVYYWADLWKSLNFGGLINPTEKLKSKVDIYQKEGIDVKVAEDAAEDSWSVLIVTPLMKRAQQLTSAGEVIFIDSSSSCDSTSSTVPVILAASLAGAVPIAIAVHKLQSTANYTSAFSLLAENYPNAFGGKSSPTLFMTDDGAAEKAALKSVWPSAAQLLCHFHVAQAEWRWLFAAKNKIRADHRQSLMKIFQKIMYAQREESLTEAIILLDNAEYPAWIRRVKGFLARKDEWLTLCRQHLMTRGHNTNNFSEATIRVLKDIILCRTKAFNVVAIVEYCSHVWEKYFVSRILDYANNRRAAPRLRYQKLCDKSTAAGNVRAVRIDETSYTVASFTNTAAQYDVNGALGCCSCPAGLQGAFCKHQALVCQQFPGAIFPNCPAIGSQGRYELGLLALGPACPPRTFFLGLTEELPGTSQESSPSTEQEPINTAFGTNDPSQPPTGDLDSDFAPEETEDYFDDFFSEIDRLRAVAGADPTVQESVRRITLKMKKASSLPQITTMMMAWRRSIATGVKSGGKIRVQPTSLARRREGITRGCRRVPAGRPSNAAPRKHALKRRHCLAASVRLNAAGSKSHGSGH